MTPDKHDLFSTVREVSTYHKRFPQEKLTGEEQRDVAILMGEILMHLQVQLISETDEHVKWRLERQITKIIQIDKMLREKGIISLR